MSPALSAQTFAPPTRPPHPWPPFEDELLPLTDAIAECMVQHRMHTLAEHYPGGLSMHWDTAHPEAPTNFRAAVRPLVQAVQALLRKFQVGRFLLTLAPDAEKKLVTTYKILDMDPGLHAEPIEETDPPPDRLEDLCDAVIDAMVACRVVKVIYDSVVPTEIQRHVNGDQARFWDLFTPLSNRIDQCFSPYDVQSGGYNIVWEYDPQQAQINIVTKRPG